MVDTQYLIPQPKMGPFHQKLFLLFLFVVLVSGHSSKNLPIISFDEGYSQLFGDDNLMLHKDGNLVHISLDERTGNLSFFLYFLEI